MSIYHVNLSAMVYTDYEMIQRDCFPFYLHFLLIMTSYKEARLDASDVIVTIFIFS